MGTVADTSIGYAGRVSEVTWASLQDGVGTEYGFKHGADLQPSSGGAGDRAMTMNPGSAFGQGVTDTWDTPAVVNHDAVTSGSLRYDTIVVTRKWGTGGGDRTSEVKINKGTGTRAITQTNDEPGNIDDQLVALVRLNLGDAVAHLEADLRTWPGKISNYLTVDALQLSASVARNDGAGAITVENGHQWVTELGTWVDLDDPGFTPFAYSVPSALVPVDTAPYVGLTHGQVYARGSIARKSGLPLLTSSATGDCFLGTFPWAPASIRRFSLPGAPKQVARCYVNSSGQLYIYADGDQIDHVYLDDLHYFVND